MRKSNKVFLSFLPIIVLLAIGILQVSLKAFNFMNKTSGCGCDFNGVTGDFDPNERAAYFIDQVINAPLAALSPSFQTQVLGENTGSDKWIEVDLSEQKLTAWDGNNKFLESLVSSGKWGKTPTGEFNIWSKFKYTKMSGGNKEDHTYYYLPNVPYTMYFYKGFGLHGTYWHNNFGHPMSHGCVNLPTVVAEKLFYWTTPILPEGKNSVTADKNNPGTKVVIHD
ncbi:MAG: L,D-transpeptidase [Patescibacteria group bacterium]|nr:L,D-transpeptidase [Patescibacteria group bacterium]